MDGQPVGQGHYRRHRPIFLWCSFAWYWWLYRVRHPGWSREMTLVETRQTVNHVDNFYLSFKLQLLRSSAMLCWACCHLMTDCLSCWRRLNHKFIEEWPYIADFFMCVCGDHRPLSLVCDQSVGGPLLVAGPLTSYIRMRFAAAIKLLWKLCVDCDNG